MTDSYSLDFCRLESVDVDKRLEFNCVYGPFDFGKIVINADELSMRIAVYICKLWRDVTAATGEKNRQK